MTTAHYVARRLFWFDDRRERHSIPEAELARQTKPVVVLAEPGAGKSELFEHAATVADAPLVSATTWLRKTRPEELIRADRPIFIDGLDEASARQDGDAIQKVLAKLDAVRAPAFILSCRAADWEARAAKEIARDYRIEPLICFLEPFSRSDATWLLGRLCPGRDASELIEHLDERGLGDFAGSPLTLELVATVLTAHGDLPSSRADLYERAAGALWAEHDRSRSGTLLASLTETEALDGAGAICAAMLMAGSDAITTAGPRLAEQGALSAYEAALLPNAERARAVLGSKLFRVERSDRFVPFHRTLAEYLGARWLGRHIGRRTRSRLMARLQPGGSVPARVRGLHAWLTRFDDELAAAAITCDPFGVIRYADVGSLSISGVRQMLASLENLATRDPYFRAGAWAKHPVAGMMREDTAHDIDVLIGLDRYRAVRPSLSVGQMEWLIAEFRFA